MESTEEQEIRRKGKVSEYSDERADQICNLISEHAESVLTLHKMFPEIVPAESTFWRWLRENPYLRKEYARAKVAQVSVSVDSLKDIVKSCPDTHEGISKARLLCDVIKWEACKLEPKTFGDKANSQVDIHINDKRIEEIKQLDNDGVSKSYKELMK